MEGVSGVGLVIVMFLGKGEMKVMKIDFSFINVEEKEVLEDFIFVVYNDVKCKFEDEM